MFLDIFKGKKAIVPTYRWQKNGNSYTLAQPGFEIEILWGFLKKISIIKQLTAILSITMSDDGIIISARETRGSISYEIAPRAAAEKLRQEIGILRQTLGRQGTPFTPPVKKAIRDLFESAIKILQLNCLPRPPRGRTTKPAATSLQLSQLPLG